MIIESFTTRTETKKGANMLKEFDIQLFGEGGGEGSSSAEGSGSTESAVVDNAAGEEIPAFIPEKAKDIYRKARNAELEKQKNSKPTAAEVHEESKPPIHESSHIPFEDLIKSDEYKEEHKAYMDKTISSRLKKYKDIEAKDSKMSQVLSVVAQKYNLDPSAEDYLDKLTEAVNADDAYVENYAIEHNLSNDEARKQIDMQRRLDTYEAEKKAREEAEEKNARTRRLVEAAERAKAVYPEFDLEREMQNERFVRLCQATNEDVLAAYQVVHHDELMQRQGLAISQRASQQIANAVASNSKRPVENGLSSQASAIVQQDFRHMNLQQIRAYADEQRRARRN